MSARFSIADRVGHAFQPPTISQGFAAWFKGGVHVSHASDRAFHAKVHGKRVAEVKIVYEAGRLHTSCTCVAKSLGLDVCKHLWAALLEADRSGALGGLRSSRAPLAITPLVTEPEDPRKEKEEKKSAKGGGRPSRRSTRAASPPREARARPRRGRRRE